MKIFVQHRETKHFLGEGIVWVRERDKARDFKNSATALEFCQHQRIGPVNILLAFDDPSFDCQIPVTPEEKPPK